MEHPADIDIIYQEYESQYEQSLYF